MKPTIPDHDLLAYADGELPEDRREAVERALADQPELAARVEQLRALNRCAHRVIHNTTPPAPEHLRQTIANLDINETDGAQPGPASESYTLKPGPRRWRWVMSAAAAVLIVGVVGWLFILSAGSGRQATPTVRINPEPLSKFASQVTQQHLMCSSLEDHFIDPSFPHSIRDVGPAAEAFMSRPVITPDLSTIGYAFAGAGPCHVPGGKTLHLLYRSEQTGHCISLFVQRPPWVIDLADGQQAIAAGPDADHPMLIWHAGNVMYYLVCDDFGACEKARHVIDQQLKS